MDEGQVGNDRREATCYHPIKIGKNEQWKYENSRRARNNNKSTGQEITRKLSRQQNERRNKLLKTRRLGSIDTLKNNVNNETLDVFASVQFF